jgi:hypothetical protein
VPFKENTQYVLENNEYPEEYPQGKREWDDEYEACNESPLETVHVISRKVGK